MFGAVGTGSVSGGIAQFTTSTLAAGTSSVTARYEGDVNHAGSTSNVVSQQVGKAATTTTLEIEPILRRRARACCSGLW